MRQIVGRCGRATADQAEQAVAAAAGGVSRPGATPTPAERAEYLFRRGRRHAPAALRAGGLGGLRVRQAVARGRRRRRRGHRLSASYYAREMLRLAEPQHRDVPGEENAYFYEPRGVAVVIAPWNFPLAILCGMTTAALVTGNTVIMKPAEQSSVIGAKLMEVFQEVGLPPGVVNYPARHRRGDRPGAGQASRRGPDRLHRLARRRPAASTAQAAELPPGQDHVKRVIAEMGGKNAIIVDDDADLDEAVHGVVASAFGYAGPEVLGLLAGHRAGGASTTPSWRGWSRRRAA